jgi:hypothetical protein
MNEEETEQLRNMYFPGWYLASNRGRTKGNFNYLVPCANQEELDKVISIIPEGISVRTEIRGDLDRLL